MFETSCKVFAIPMKVKRVWNRIRFFLWFRATLTSLLYILMVNDIKNHQKGYFQFQAEIEPDMFKRVLLTHHVGITTGWKCAGKVSRDNTKARESML